MMYTKIQFGKELKEKVLKRQDVAEIGHWTYSVYLQYIEDINDPCFDNILLTLNKMEDGPEFTFTYERLNEIADDLIASNDVNLDY